MIRFFRIVSFHLSVSISIVCDMRDKNTNINEKFQ